MADKICPNCLQEWPGCVCVIGARGGGGFARGPHPLLSRQLIRVGPPTVPPRPVPVPHEAGAGPVALGLRADYPKEFCPDCHQRWQACKCAGRRI